jgi:hypothetical protein
MTRDDLQRLGVTPEEIPDPQRAELDTVRAG